MKIAVDIPVDFYNQYIPDFPKERYCKRVEAEISDDDILRIGKRYFELASNPVNNMTFERVVEK